MAESAREQILERLALRAHHMSSGRGYNYDWKGCARWRMMPPDNAGYPFLSLVDEQEAIEYGAANRLLRRLQIGCWAWHSVTHTKNDAPATAASRLVEDLERMLMEDPHVSDLAIDTRLTASTTYVSETDDPSILVSVMAEVVYRTNIEEPTDAV
jgi:hypothetical protein